MKNLILFLSLSSITLIAFAQKANLTVVDPYMDATPLENEFNVNRPNNPNSLPSKDERDIFLQKLTKKISQWDELKKDIFYMELKSKSISELQTKYPELSAKELKELKGLR